MIAWIRVIIIGVGEAIRFYIDLAGRRLTE